MRTISETEFRIRLIEYLAFQNGRNFKAVTGPGRSGAIAAVYASHYLKVPFIPYGQPAPFKPGVLLIVDTAAKTGETMRKAMRKYVGHDILPMWFFSEPPRVKFWYEEISSAAEEHRGSEDGAGQVG